MVLENLKELRVAVSVLRTGSFSKAAREHNIVRATASKHIANLEHELGMRLFERNTRIVTVDGASAQKFLQDAETFIRFLDQAVEEVTAAGS